MSNYSLIVKVLQIDSGNRFRTRLGRFPSFLGFMRFLSKQSILWPTLSSVLELFMPNICLFACLKLVLEIVIYRAVLNELFKAPFLWLNFLYVLWLFSFSFMVSCWIIIISIKINMGIILGLLVNSFTTIGVRIGLREKGKNPSSLTLMHHPIYRYVKLIL